MLQDPMHRKIRFKIGERVNGFTLDNKRILGTYRGVKNSFGALIFGIEVGSFEHPTLWTCSTLTLERADLRTQKEPKSKTQTRVKAGDPCTGQTKSGQVITGYYMNSEGQHAWIRGWAQGVSKFMPKEAHKVIAGSIRYGLALE